MLPVFITVEVAALAVAVHAIIVPAEEVAYLGKGMVVGVGQFRGTLITEEVGVEVQAGMAVTETELMELGEMAE